VLRPTESDAVRRHLLALSLETQQRAAEFGTKRVNNRTVVVGVPKRAQNGHGVRSFTVTRGYDFPGVQKIA
jgi:hypothetical protein